eukprot:TRINITY_DN114336_c0_g1_i1.p1 TRINITY_DN114336_c0_g1~~TRINITY_DN114336_c0_g1_i1.p1  ORF type:complete len:192 (+),score=20.66 TRINITY_DN114336_c0_g1_i1:2-577(+)
MPALVDTLESSGVSPLVTRMTVLLYCFDTLMDGTVEWCHAWRIFSTEKKSSLQELTFTSVSDFGLRMGDAQSRLSKYMFASLCNVLLFLPACAAFRSWWEGIGLQQSLRWAFTQEPLLILANTPVAVPWNLFDHSLSEVVHKGTELQIKAFISKLEDRFKESRIDYDDLVNDIARWMFCLSEYSLRFMVGA